MGYTKEQQSRIDNANAKVESAQKAYDSAVKERDYHYLQMQTIFNSTAVSGDCYKNPQPSFEAQVAWGTLNENNCKSKCKPECPQAVTAYNVERGRYNAGVTDASSKLNTLNIAKQELATLLDAIKNEIQNDPQFIHDQTQIEQNAINDAKAKRLRIWFWIIATLVAGGLLFTWFKWGRKWMGKKGSSGSVVAG